MQNTFGKDGCTIFYRWIKNGKFNLLYMDKVLLISLLVKEKNLKWCMDNQPYYKKVYSWSSNLDKYNLK
jgi:hypothetical protein